MIFLNFFLRILRNVQTEIFCAIFVALELTIKIASQKIAATLVRLLSPPYRSGFEHVGNLMQPGGDLGANATNIPHESHGKSSLVYTCE